MGAAGLVRLVERFGSASAACAAGDRALASEKVPEAARQWIATPDAALVDADLAWLAHPDAHLVPWTSPDYPPLLRRAAHPPAALFVAGDVDLAWTPQVAVVGSRNPTSGGRDNAAAFAAELARHGFTVTSGLAEGIDAAAHRAALDAGRPTLAVVGTGPDRVYPSRHRELAIAVRETGAIVSEFPPGTPARRDHFPRRNRIIAGLSLGTLVVEAGLTSGALITARLAAEAGREVFALPGSIHNPLARGCHRLIRDGAQLVETVQEITAALAPIAAQLADALRTRLAIATSTPQPGAGRARAQAPAGAADPDYETLLAALGHDPVGIDELALRTGLTVGVLSSMLLVMELEGRVKAEHGRYALTGS